MVCSGMRLGHYVIVSRVEHEAACCSYTFIQSPPLALKRCWFVCDLYHIKYTSNALEEAHYRIPFLVHAIPGRSRSVCGCSAPWVNGLRDHLLPCLESRPALTDTEHRLDIADWKLDAQTGCAAS